MLFEWRRYGIGIPDGCPRGRVSMPGIPRTVGRSRSGLDPLICAVVRRVRLRDDVRESGRLMCVCVCVLSVCVLSVCVGVYLCVVVCLSVCLSVCCCLGSRDRVKHNPAKRRIWQPLESTGSQTTPAGRRNEQGRRKRSSCVSSFRRTVTVSYHSPPVVR